MSESYVTVRTDSDSGSGSIIAHRGRRSFVLTCAHVVRNCKKPFIVYRDGSRFHQLAAAVVAVDTENDLALLRVSTKIKRRPIDVADDAPGMYTRGYVMGSHAGLHGTAGEVLITALDNSNGSRAVGKLIQFTGAAASGMSGGMLCDVDGDLVGVPHLLERVDDYPLGCIGFAVPLDIVKGFLDGNLPD
jgi:S1-C subfamily serine protease